MQKKLSFGLFAAALAAMAICLQPRAASANIGPTVLPPASTACPTGQERQQALARMRDTIARAESIDKARALALAPTDAAIGALSKARMIMPLSRDLRLAHAKLADARSRIEAADTPDQVADELMILAGLDNDKAAHLQIGDRGCNYSTGEIIAIVLGLILGIIPGVILLILLC